MSTLETHNHPVNIALSTCQPLKCPPPEKINTMVGIPAPGEDDPWSSAILPYASRANLRLTATKITPDPKYFIRAPSPFRLSPSTVIYSYLHLSTPKTSPLLPFATLPCHSSSLFAPIRPNSLQKNMVPPGRMISSPCEQSQESPREASSSPDHQKVGSKRG